ncbi:hypothetical protein LRP31_09255 [Mesorhizobium mediterraneum]|uniref:hypothetical protein n=1 Tax=Mesorhizobium TaxID=68287 RepID=UPI000FD1FE97|nr:MULTISPECIES: hypothetical protein [Mesorhizobium]RUV03212.1 hypothetical protein EOB36_07495 [Mesorhizobium sp. M6A.T.Cr.TU.017.01.1.1]RWN29921.1 MAG: hypothetical protein EOR96_31385 [Mesorhizobium sp.]RWP42597.1 MAG: hypothetical protein EOR05_29220 [Mesorhizobium sp.]RWP50500.1 MAG: hypothetical protein EOR06_23950 [Mesorhizobium sp.]RWP71321.1 MAG: hypothetical protein EOR10_29885 [Mesorhizobium sp.]
MAGIGGALLEVRFKFGQGSHPVPGHGPASRRSLLREGILKHFCKSWADGGTRPETRSFLQAEKELDGKGWLSAALRAPVKVESESMAIAAE